jgi:hypothetical protein
LFACKILLQLTGEKDLLLYGTVVFVYGGIKTSITNNDRTEPHNSFVAFSYTPRLNNLTLSSLQFYTVLNGEKAQYLPRFITLSGNPDYSWANRDLKIIGLLESGRDIVVV